jgi:DNA invertase Pin-like site-specific DNA recombinase
MYYCFIKWSYEEKEMTRTRDRAIAYYRVSTEAQGLEGYGMEAQREDVRTYCEKNDYDLVDEYEEVESGKKDRRPQLDEALNALATMRDTTGKTPVLVIAKIDRLTRDLHFLTTLQREQVRFEACDMKDANNFTLQIMVSVAEQERKLISERTKKGLERAKIRLAKEGRTLGNPNLQAGNARTAAIATEARVQKSKEFAQRLKPIYDQCISEGRTSLKDIAACLNEKSRTTARGKPWTTSTVSNLEKQLEVSKRS